MIKILYIEGWGDFKGGGPRSFFNLISHLDRKKYDPIVVCPASGALLDAFKKINVKVEIIKAESLKAVHLFSFIRATDKLLKLIKEEKVALIHSNAGASRESFYSLVAAKIMGIPFIYHSRVIESAGIIERILAKMSTRIIVISEAVRKKFRWIKNEEKIVKIYNGVDLKNFNPEISGQGIREEFGIPPEAMVIGTVGNLIPWKGHKYFLQAAKEIKDKVKAKFIIVGEDLTDKKKYKKELEVMAEDLGIRDDLIFTDFREDIPQIMAAFDIFVLPSINEPFGRVLIEAMACGKPVVATEGGGVPEIVKDAQTGILVPMENPSAISKAVISLLEDNKRAKELGLSGRKRAEDFFGIETNVKQTENLYCSFWK